MPKDSFFTRSVSARAILPALLTQWGLGGTVDKIFNLLGIALDVQTSY